MVQCKLLYRSQLQTPTCRLREGVKRQSRTSGCKWADAADWDFQACRCRALQSVNLWCDDDGRGPLCSFTVQPWWGETWHDVGLVMFQSREESRCNGVRKPGVKKIKAPLPHVSSHWVCVCVCETELHNLCVCICFFCFSFSHFSFIFFQRSEIIINSATD